MAEKIVTLCFFLGSILYLFFAQQLTFGTLRSPKSGFLPVLAGGVAIILVVFIINQLWAKQAQEREKVDWTKFIFVILGLSFYIISLFMIGYFTATFILLLYLFKVADTVGWIVPIVAAAGISLSFYFLFDRFLAVTLP